MDGDRRSILFLFLSGSQHPTPIDLSGPWKRTTNHKQGCVANLIKTSRPFLRKHSQELNSDVDAVHTWEVVNKIYNYEVSYQQLLPFLYNTSLSRSKSFAAFVLVSAAIHLMTKRRKNIKSS